MTLLPSEVMLRYLGVRAKKSVAYGTASISGVMLSICSCNIVPLFASIYRSGAGIGPAITFLYAGPAVNFVSAVFVFKILGWRLGIWRAVGVPILSIIIGLIMAVLFRHTEQKRDAIATDTLEMIEEKKNAVQLLVLFGLLLGIFIVGSSELQMVMRFPMLLFFLVALCLVVSKWLNKEELKEWLLETFRLMRTIVPILIVCLLLIGFVADFVNVKTVIKYVGANTLGATFIASVFGSFMYFPILAEVAFTKAFLKLGMDVGPALTLLLTGPGLSLPGMLLIYKFIGFTKTAVYVGLLILFTTVIGMLFGKVIGPYACPCMTLPAGK